MLGEGERGWRRNGNTRKGEVRANIQKGKRNGGKIEKL